MAQPNYSTSDDQYVDEETMYCSTPSQSSVTLFSSEYNALPKSNNFDQYNSTGQNLPSDNPYSQLYSPEYGPMRLSPTFAERYMNFDELTSPGPQCILPTPLPPIHTFRIPRFQYSYCSAWNSPTPETVSPKSESLLPPQNLPSDNPYSHLYLPEYEPLGLSPTFAERYMNCDEVTSPSPTSYNLLGLPTSTSNVIYNQTSECQRDLTNVSESSSQLNDSRTSGTSSSYIENKFPAFCHSNYSSPSQPELVKQASSSFNTTNLDSHKMLCLPPNVDQQCTLSAPLPPIHSFRMPRFQDANCSAWISPTPETVSPKLESLLPPPIDKAQVPTSESLLPSSTDKAQVKVRSGTHMCSACNIGFITKSELNSHYQLKVHRNKIINSRKPDPAPATSSIKTNVTAEPTTHKCTTCNKPFTTKGQLKSHYQKKVHKDKVEIIGKPDPAIVLVDGQVSEFYCKPCNRTFESPVYFKRHNARHKVNKTDRKIKQ